MSKLSKIALTNRKRKLIARFQRYSSSGNASRLSEKLNKSIENTTTVSEIGLASRIEKLQYPDVNEAMLLANSPEFKPFISNFCNKSGKFLYNYSLERFSDMLSIHGKEKTKSLLIQLSTSNYSLEWLTTDSSTLNKLMLQDASGYLVYAANHLFELLPPKTAKNKTIDFTGVPEQYQEFYLRLQDKIIARDNFEKLDLKLVLECSELIRRLIGLSAPTKVALQGFFEHTNLIDISKSSISLQIFIENIKKNLTFLLQKHFKSIESSTRFQMVEQKNMELYGITANDIAKIKAKLGGLDCFHKQPSIRKQSKRVSILLDLKAFVINEMDMDIEGELWEDLDGFETPKKEQELLNNFSISGEFDSIKLDRSINKKPVSSVETLSIGSLGLLSGNKEKKEKNEEFEIKKNSGFKLNL